MRRLAALLLAPALIVLPACGGGSSDGSSDHLPTASGSYGEKPKLTFPAGDPSGKLETKVLKPSDGETVAKGDLLIADYLGQIWKGKAFDNSYDRHQPIAFQIGAGKVIPGWDKELVGQKVGSRVLLNIPPAEGYGAAGNTQAGIKGTDTLEFVVDIVDAFGKNATAGAATAKKVTGSVPKSEPQVSGPLTGEPKITVVKGSRPPATPRTRVIARGSGAPLKPGLAVVRFAAFNWEGKPVQSTFTTGGPQAVPVGVPAQKSPFDPLKGVPVGSRVLIEVPSQDGKRAVKSSFVIVTDIVARSTTAKEKTG